jgi:hypothetical protein
MPDKRFISLDFNSICNSYQLDPEQLKDGKLNIYLTLNWSFDKTILRKSSNLILQISNL